MTCVCVCVCVCVILHLAWGILKVSNEKVKVCVCVCVLVCAVCTVLLEYSATQTVVLDTLSAMRGTRAGNAIVDFSPLTSRRQKKIGMQLLFLAWEENVRDGRQRISVVVQYSYHAWTCGSVFITGLKLRPLVDHLLRTC